MRVPVHEEGTSTRRKTRKEHFLCAVIKLMIDDKAQYSGRNCPNKYQRPLSWIPVKAEEACQGEILFSQSDEMKMRCRVSELPKDGGYVIFLDRQSEQLVVTRVDGVIGFIRDTPDADGFRRGNSSGVPASQLPPLHN